MTIGELSRRTGVSQMTIDYYSRPRSRKGAELLRCGTDPKSRYREYDDESEERLGKIRDYRKMGFSIEEVRELLESPKEHIREMVERQIERLKDEKIRSQKRYEDMASFAANYLKENLKEE